MALFKKPAETYNDENDSFYDEEYGATETAGGDDFSMGMQTPAEPAPAAVAPTAPALKIVNPREYKDAVEIANLLINGNTILLNVESIAKEHAIRLLDYLNGAVHVAGGLMTKVSKTTIVIAPKNVDVSSIEAMVSGD